MPHLLQLPAVVLHHTLESLSDEELYALGFISRRLHDIALRLFLHRHKIADPTTEVNLTLHQKSRKVTVLSVIRVALFVSTVEKLTCDFHPDARYKSPDHLRVAFSPLLALLSKLDRVGELTLNLRRSFPVNFPLDCWNPMWSPTIRRGAEWDIFKLLREPLTIKECSRLTMTNSHGDSRIYDLPRKTSPPLKWTVDHILRKSASRPALRPVALTLSTFVAKSAWELFAGNSHKAQPALNSLKTLKLSCPPIPLNKWAIMDPRLAVKFCYPLDRIAANSPRLTTLVVDSPVLCPTNLLILVSELLELTSLTVSMIGAVLQRDKMHDIPTHTNLTFPSLVHLHAPPQYVLVILHGMKSLSKLESIQIRIPDWDEDPADLFIAAAVQLCPREASVDVIFGFEDGFIYHDVDDFSMTVNQPLRHARVAPRVMNMLDNQLRTQLVDMRRGRVCYALQKLTILSSAPVVSNSPSDRFCLSLLGLWLRQFPGLCHLEFAEPSSPFNHLPPLHLLLRCISMHCPKIETVTVLGHRHSILSEGFTHEGNLIQRVHRTSLADLPEDVVLVISEHLSNNDIYSLIQTTPNILNTMSAVYLRRRGHLEPWKSLKLCMLEVEYDPLMDISVLIMSPVHTIEHLTCHIALDRPFLVFEYLVRLRRLILKLSSIGQLVLEFNCNSAQWRFSHAMKEAWMNFLTSILTAAHERSCTSLVIYGDIFFDDGSETPSINVDALVSPFGSTPLLQASPTPLPTILSHSPRSLLCLDSTNFRSHAFREWVHSATEKRLISSLNIWHHRIGDFNHMSGLLSHLTELNLASIGVLSESPAFLHGLPLLTSLSLREFRYERSETGDRPASMPRLPFLRKLTAPKAYILFWLSADPNALPSLEHLSLFLKEWPGPSIQALQGMVNVIRGLFRRGRFTQFSLDVSIQACSYITQCTTDAHQWSNLSKWVSGVTFVDYRRTTQSSLPTRPDLIHGIRNCLAIFPAVRHIAFDNVERSMVDHAICGIPKERLYLMTLEVDGVRRDLHSSSKSDAFQIDALSENWHRITP